MVQNALLLSAARISFARFPECRNDAAADSAEGVVGPRPIEAEAQLRRWHVLDRRWATAFATAQAFNIPMPALMATSRQKLGSTITATIREQKNPLPFADHAAPYQVAVYVGAEMAYPKRNL